MDDLLGGGFALYAHINVFICIFGLMVPNLTCIDMNKEREAPKRSWTTIGLTLLYFVTD